MGHLVKLLEPTQARNETLSTSTWSSDNTNSPT